MLPLFALLVQPRTTEKYAGSLLGVHARVELDEVKRLADVTLRGLPLGGEISGTGWFELDGSLRVHPDIERVMKRRACSIINASRTDQVLTIFLNLPLFGIRKLEMKLMEE